jgi:hypothetical protein
MEDDDMETFITQAMANATLSDGNNDDLTGIPAEPGTESMVSGAAGGNNTEGFFGKLFAAGNGARANIKEYNRKKKEKKLAKLKASLENETSAANIKSVQQDIEALTQEIHTLSLEDNEERMRDAWNKGTRGPRTYEEKAPKTKTTKTAYTAAEPSKFEQWLLGDGDDDDDKEVPSSTGAAKNQDTPTTTTTSSAEDEQRKKAWLAGMERLIRDAAPVSSTAKTTTTASAPPLTDKTTVQDFMDRHERDIRRRETTVKDAPAAVVAKKNNSTAVTSKTMPTTTVAPSMGQVKAEMQRQMKNSPISTQLSKLDDLMMDLNAPSKEEESTTDELMPDGGAPETDAFARGARDWLQRVVSLKPLSSYDGVVPLRDSLTKDDLIDTIQGGKELQSDTLSVSVDKTRQSIVVSRNPLQVVRGNTRILIFRRVNDPVALTKASMFSLNKSVLDPARITIKFSHPIHGTPAKILLRPAENEKQALLDEHVWVGQGIKNRLYILRFSDEDNHNNDALQEVILVYPTANIAEAYHQQELTRAERMLGDLLVSHVKRNVHLSTEFIPPVTKGTNAFTASLAVAAAFAHATPQTTARVARDHILSREKDTTKAAKVSPHVASTLQHYIDGLETLSAEATRIYKVTEEDVAGDRGKLLATYVQDKIADPKMASQVTAALSDAWKVLHMQTTGGHIQETKNLRDKYLAALAKSTGQTPPAYVDFFG